MDAALECIPPPACRCNVSISCCLTCGCWDNQHPCNHGRLYLASAAGCAHLQSQLSLAGCAAAALAPVDHHTGPRQRCQDVRICRRNDNRNRTATAAALMACHEVL